MPIVRTNSSTGTVALGPVTTILTLERTAQSFVTVEGTVHMTYDANSYSHSTVHIVPENSGLENGQFPPLTKRYTYSSGCFDRWMLAGQQELFRNFAFPTIATTINYTGVTSSGYTPQPFTVFSMNLNGTAIDSGYGRCQPATFAAQTYSPGVCPAGLTMAEVTAYQKNASTGYRTFWQGSCCKSGMTFGPEYPEACIGTLSTPVIVRALVTSTLAGGGFASPVYEYLFHTYVSSLTSNVISTNSSTTVISTGLALADPVVVAWQTDDYKDFPPDYVSSLIKRYTLSVPSSTTLSPAAGGDSPKPSGLSGGAKIGIGLGVGVAALTLLIGVVMYLLSRRRRSNTHSQVQERPIAEMADQDHDHAKKKWWIGGKWRSEAQTHGEPQEMDNKTIHVVPGPPAELDGVHISYPNETGRPVLRE